MIYIYDIVLFLTQHLRITNTKQLLSKLFQHTCFDINVSNIYLLSVAYLITGHKRIEEYYLLY